jgi:hypothetical protein
MYRSYLQSYPTGNRSSALSEHPIYNLLFAVCRTRKPAVDSVDSTASEGRKVTNLQHVIQLGLPDVKQHQATTSVSLRERKDHGSRLTANMI